MQQICIWSNQKWNVNCILLSQILVGWIPKQQDSYWCTTIAHHFVSCTNFYLKSWIGWILLYDTDKVCAQLVACAQIFIRNTETFKHRCYDDLFRLPELYYLINFKQSVVLLLSTISNHRFLSSIHCIISKNW